jgi:feruloyl esterase
VSEGERHTNASEVLTLLAPHRWYSCVLLVLAALCIGGISYAEAATCKSLEQLKIPQTTIVKEESFEAGKFVPPGKEDPRLAERFKRIPAFCRVQVLVETEPGNSSSRINMEVWLPPEAAWNHKFRGEGNGGFAGSINYGGLAGSVTGGYATASTDTGHQGDATDADWALNQPAKIKNFGYLAIHEMTEKAKLIVMAYYRKAPEHTYFDSCSNGGRQALMEAQRYPNDYNGILAGAPANNWTNLISTGVLTGKALSGEGWLPPAKLPAINAAVLKACDLQDGVKDGVLANPTLCHFDPGTLLCQGSETDRCLTAKQVSTLKTIYGGAKDQSGKQLFPGALPGSELGDGGWKNWIVGETSGNGEGQKYPQGFFRNMVYSDATWSITTADPAKARRDANERLAQTLNSTDADLTAFYKSGGKLIIYHGWNDPAIPALSTVNYYEQVKAKFGSSTRNFTRLYLVGGMQHCAGGPGATFFGQLGLPTTAGEKGGVFGALEEWVEHGKEPAGIVATRYVEDNPAKGAEMTRPLCEYPGSVVYKGRGDVTKAENYRCQ